MVFFTDWKSIYRTAGSEPSGRMGDFGPIDDPAPSRFTKGSERDKKASKAVMNYYLNRLHRTAGLEYASYEVEYAGI